MRLSFVRVALVLSLWLGIESQAGLIIIEDDSFATVTSNSLNATCAQISKAISKDSEVFFPFDTTGRYTADNFHYATSSSQPSACSVEPGTAQDVGAILQILGNNKTPFAVKGGGHAMNPNFSSTPGVQISMTRFNEIHYDTAKKTADVGSGLTWDNVYAVLDPLGVNVVGGRATGIGVAGFTLGGGYSWLTNQYGLGVDNVAAFELVLPSGSVKVVTQSDTDLFFALKGGFNKFGGSIALAGEDADNIKAATLKFFDEVTDPKAAIITSFALDPAFNVTACSLLLFYDAPQPPAGMFDDFLQGTVLAKNISTRSFLSLVQAGPSNSAIGQRGVYQPVPVQTLDETFLDAVINETLGRTLPLPVNASVAISVELFLPNILSHGSDSAYPFDRTTAFNPTNLDFAWTSEADDQFMFDATTQSSERLTAVAVQSGQKLDSLAPLYPNYAIFSTPLEKIYGSNLARLQRIKSVYDPSNVMGQAGGWKF
ncbi:hypothetical protein EUX98_g5291 [Antrodiella citrinella]|uniref:FAD-binding PCMH-type domain-containing protein n=1 Tax=Antrodiella citrinella TaxID=2447956 RepID=A0A4S4MS52_9APHY|nr:hypothetical protein EUX98_g5291 [Antrodiella citrinella]